MKNTICLTLIAVISLCGVCTASDAFELKPSELLEPLPPVCSYLFVDIDSTGSKFLDMSGSGASSDKISMKKAMLLSFLLPGAGEYYAGAKFKGQIFMGVEAAIWAGFLSHRVYGGWKEDDYKSYAAAHAGVINEGKDEQYYDWLGFYNSREEFNQFGRLFFPERAYLPDTDDYDWQWDSQAHRERYKEIKDDAKRAFRNANFFLGMALVNRIISGIDTYRTVKSAQKKLRSITQFGEYKLKIKSKPWGDNPSLKVELTRKF